jgi:hypothetical protein
MKTKYIPAVSGIHAILKNNNIEIIGLIETKKRKNLKGDFITISEVIFHYGNKSQDHFEFVDGKLVHYLISKYTPDYLNKAYEECIDRERLIDEFVNKITSTYVFHELGF